MKKILLSLIVAVAAITTAFGQVFMAAPARPANAPAEGELEWIQLCDPTVEEVAGVGTQAEGIDLGAGMTFSSSFLTDYNGKSLSVVAICLYTPLTDVTVEVKKGDVNNGETLFTKKVGILAAGWNYIKLDTPVAIDGASDISILYKGKDTTKFPLAFDGKKGSAPKGSAFLSTQGAAFEEDLQFGALMIRALVGGDESGLANSVVLSELQSANYIKKGEAAKFTLTLANNTFSTVESITLASEINGNKTEKEITFDTPIAANDKYAYEFESEALQENTTFKFAVTKVNGADNPTAANVLEKVVSVYEGEDAVQRTILIEKYTGQACPNCPAGETAILKAIEGQEEHVARIDHHTYYTDLFSINESSKLAQFFGANYAPACAMDRTTQEDRNSLPADYRGIIWHPGYMTADMVANEISKPAFVSINIESEFKSETRELTVKVTGKSALDMTGKKMNVVLTQSGYIAQQSGAGANYEFNDFPIIFLTDYKGDAMTADADGNYEMEFTCTIKDSYSNSQGTRKVDYSQLKLVAFVTDWSTKDNSEVYNAAVAKVDAEVGINDTEAAGVRFYAADSKVAVEGNCTEMSVYDVTGAQVENENLNGLYIVKAVVDGKTYTLKVVVR